MTNSLSASLRGKRVCVCAGAGGVGKTTSAAAIALGLAAQGLRVAVLTIDPAPRLANVLGLDRLDNDPHRVAPSRLADAGITLPGELWAMVLDPKRTFDELVAQLSRDDHARERTLSNRIYHEFSTALAGSQEFTAVAKLYELDREHRFDVIVLDTPPSRNAMDFLDAPARLTRFFDGSALRLLRGSGGIAARVVGVASAPMLAVLRRVTGVDLLGEIAGFLSSIGGMVDGFAERAAGVDELLHDDGTTFVLVSSPERAAVAESLAFADALAKAGFPLGGAIVNRMHVGTGPSTDPGLVAKQLDQRLGPRLARLVSACAADSARVAARDQRAVAALSERLDGCPLALVPELDGEVLDLGGLWQIARELLGELDGGASVDG